MYANKQIDDKPQISTHYIPCTLVDNERRLTVVMSILVGLWKIDEMSNGKDPLDN